MSGNEATPHLRLMNEILSDIRSHVASIHHTHNAVDQLKEAVNKLLQQAELQTDTAAQMSILMLQSELEAINCLLEEESRQVSVLIERGEADIERQKAVFAGSMDGVASDRNRQVGDLLRPIYDILDHDADAHIERRYPSASRHLQAFGETLEENVREREEAIVARISAVTELLQQYMRSRPAVERSKERVRFDSGGVVPETLSVPYYMIRFRDRNSDAIRAAVIPPSVVEGDSSSLSGQVLKSVPHLDAYAQVMSGRLPEPAAVRVEFGGLEMADRLPPTSGVFRRWAMKMLKKKLSVRSTKLTD